MIKAWCSWRECEAKLVTMKTVMFMISSGNVPYSKHDAHNQKWSSAETVDDHEQWSTVLKQAQWSSLWSRHVMSMSIYMALSMSNKLLCNIHQQSLFVHDQVDFVMMPSKMYFLWAKAYLNIYMVFMSRDCSSLRQKNFCWPWAHRNLTSWTFNCPWINIFECSRSQIVHEFSRSHWLSWAMKHCFF